jgi:hypothetical protein
MKTIKERLVVVWDDDGNFKGASLDERTVLDDGRTLNAQRPLTEADADELVGTVDAATIAQLEAVTTERDEALAANQPLTDQVAALQSRINELTAEPDVAIVSRRQGRLALLGADLLKSVEAAVYADGANPAYAIEYEADAWRRDNPTLIALSEALGLTSDQLDGLFAAAGKL